MRKMISVGLVPYTNSLPYLWALHQLQKTMQIDIAVHTPSELLIRFQKGEFDFCLLPTVGLAKKHSLASVPLQRLPFGIACIGDVLSVCLLSQQRQEDTHTVYADPESKTSNALFQVLATHFFKHVARFSSLPPNASLHEIPALISIGDKVFEQKKQFTYCFDLGALWQQYTGCGFVFAQWIARSHVNVATVARLVSAFEKSVATLEEWLTASSNELSERQISYLKHTIHYVITDKLLEGLQTFLRYV